jgi:hypothetical protein
MIFQCSAVSVAEISLEYNDLSFVLQLPEEHCDWLMDRQSLLICKPHKNDGILCLFCFSVVTTLKSASCGISSHYRNVYHVTT